MQRLPISDIHNAQLETLAKEKESKHKGDVDEEKSANLHAWPCLTYRTG